MDIQLGDKFYFNSYCVDRHMTLPDYLIVTAFKHNGAFVEAQYENHFVDTQPRTFAVQNLQFDSNLNPRREKPSWIFLKAIEDSQK